VIERCISELGLRPSWVGTFFGHRLKYVEGHYKSPEDFNFKIVYALLRFLKDNGLAMELAVKMLPVVYQHPKMDFESVLTSLKFKKISKDDIVSQIPFLRKKFSNIRRSPADHVESHWIMGQLQGISTGNLALADLRKMVDNQ
jgi:glutamyl-tRNA(Gln) amidotransferase subunit E